MLLDQTNLLSHDEHKLVAPGFTSHLEDIFVHYHVVTGPSTFLLGAE